MGKMSNQTISELGAQRIPIMEAQLERVIPEYRSQAEREWAWAGPQIIADELGELTLRRDYEPVTFHLPGGVRYKPDFWHICESGRVVVVEVKEGKHLKSYRDARARMRICAGFYPIFIYVMADRADGWSIERI